MTARIRTEPGKGKRVWHDAEQVATRQGPRIKFKCADTLYPVTMMEFNTKPSTCKACTKSPGHGDR